MAGRGLRWDLAEGGYSGARERVRRRRRRRRGDEVRGLAYARALPDALRGCGDADA